MNGNDNQYDPTTMFKEWIQKGGKAQMDFFKTFGDIMGHQGGRFNPADTLKDIVEKNTKTQADFMQNIGDFQTKAMNSWTKMSQSVPQFLSWGAFKTAVGSNGRISIPEAERDALKIGEGDLVQVIIVPIEKKRKQGVKK
ncbi:MAG: transcriptional regulator [Thaumarchaeota archaeon 13_1_40CM_4_38_7]|nr:MAG: transcriptional regulator [Thaumarchaeota archaeon 13_1_40CM_4_38_7]OLD40469.1 MAG: transcriptional regulator [Thaumarchaeota archaeon 13_1_40CM_2_39_4]